MHFSYKSDISSNMFITSFIEVICEVMHFLYGNDMLSDMFIHFLYGSEIYDVICCISGMKVICLDTSYMDVISKMICLCTSFVVVIFEVICWCTSDMWSNMGAICEVKY